MARGRGGESFGSHVRHAECSNTQMKLVELLRQQQPSILVAWVDLIMGTYPAETRRFLQKQKDSFANPVGTTISAELERVFTELLEGPREERLGQPLDKILRIRAVQDFTASQAVSFVLHLKKVIRDQLGEKIREYGLSDELAEMEGKIDDMALLSFDIYMKCREKLYEVKADQAGRQVARLLQKAGLTCEIPAWKPKEKEKDQSE